MGAGFESLGLEPPLLQAVREMGISEPFPIHATAIAPLLEGRDLIGQAHTGAGKTLAFALPMLQKIDQLAPGIQGLVIVPTRELALQVAREFEKLAKHLRVRVAAIYGGQSMWLQVKKLRDRSCSIIVATPGRLIDHLDRRTVSLDKTSFVVLDEADRMLDMGFIDDVRIILSHISRIHQTALFSATMSNEIVLLNQEHITKGLIFCETKVRAGGLAQALQDEHYKALPLHSDLSQFQRDSAVHSFRIGLTNLLVATEVAARGLDIPKVSHVVNYDMPEEPKMYFHRIGRTARAGKPGVAISLITRQDEDGFKRIRKMTSSDLREVTDGIPAENRVGSKFLLPARPSQRQAGQRLSSGRRPQRYNRRERSYRRNRRR